MNTELSFMVNFADQPIVLRIAHSMRSMRMFDLERNSAKQVHEVLQKLDANKASGYDAIQIKSVMIGAAELAYPIYKLFNVCIEKGKSPAE